MNLLCDLFRHGGRENFRNEIIWCYSTSGRAKRFFAPKHDTILLYTKSGQGYWGDYRIPVPQKYLESHYKQQDAKGNRVRIRVDAGKERVYYPEEGMTCNDWWDIPYVNSQAKERTGFPTQKPLALYERMIEASSREGDLVLDPFAGCATTCIAAEIHGREWIAIDINREAQGVVKKRLRQEARLPRKGQSWDRAIKVRTTPPPPYRRRRKGCAGTRACQPASERPQDVRPRDQRASGGRGRRIVPGMRLRAARWPH